MAREPLSLKARAIGLLAQREQSRAELKRKLLRIEQQRARQAAAARGRAAGGRQVEGEADPIADSQAVEAEPFDTAEGCDASDALPARENEVDALLDSLAGDGYLDESRFVASRLHLRAGRFGVQRIQQELAQHGLRLDADQQATLRASELDRAREVWRKRFGPEPATEPAERARQTRFLLARGFAADVVRRLLRSSD